MNDLELSVNKLNDLIINGQTLEAIEIFYAENVMVQENEESPMEDKKIYWQ